jgi:hypothetical protein
MLSEALVGRSAFVQVLLDDTRHMGAPSAVAGPPLDGNSAAHLQPGRLVPLDHPWQVNRKDATSARNVAHANHSAAGFDPLAADEQTKTEAASIRATLSKSAEQFFHLARGEASALLLDLNFDSSSFAEKEPLSRFADRLDDPMKQWTIGESDYKEPELWDAYMTAYEEVPRQSKLKATTRRRTVAA